MIPGEPGTNPGEPRESEPRQTGASPAKPGPARTDRASQISPGKPRATRTRSGPAPSRTSPTHTPRPQAQKERYVPTALVTGGNRGIGLGITRSLLAEGYAVAILATRPEPAELIEELRESGDVIYVQGSVAEQESHERFVQAALQRWGRIDLLVNNAGVAPTVRADILEAEGESFDRVLGVNLREPYFLT